MSLTFEIKKAGGGNPSVSSLIDKIEFTANLGTTQYWPGSKTSTTEISSIDYNTTDITALAYRLHSGSGAKSWTAYASLSALNTAIAALTDGDEFEVEITATISTSTSSAFIHINYTP